MLERFGFGFLGGVGGAIVTMPIDVTKSIAQKQQGLEVRSTVQIVQDVVRSSGIRGLYTGLIPRLGRVGLDRAFGFLGTSIFPTPASRQVTDPLVLFQPSNGLLSASPAAVTSNFDTSVYKPLQTSSNWISLKQRRRPLPVSYANRTQMHYAKKSMSWLRFSWDPNFIVHYKLIGRIWPSKASST